MGQPLWHQNASTGKWYSLETGEEVDVEVMSLEELIKKLVTDRI